MKINSNIKLTIGLGITLLTLVSLNYQFSFTKNYSVSGIWYAANTNEEIPNSYVSITECNKNTVIEITESIIKAKTTKTQVIVISRLSNIFLSL
jgi:hypothetical protein